jgi:phosphoglycerol transferase MdoB-like AlkP superfamily enzyme
VGPAVVKQPLKVDVPGCQLDVAPTLLGLIGRPYETVFYGRDLLHPAADRFALLNHNRSIGIYRAPNMVALSLGRVTERFSRVNRNTLQRESLGSEGKESADDVTALFQTADELYRAHHFAVRPPATARSLSLHSAPSR